MPPLAKVKLSQRAPALSFVIDIGQCVQRLVDGAKYGDDLDQPGRVLADLERAHDAGGEARLSLANGLTVFYVPLHLKPLYRRRRSANRCRTQNNASDVPALP